MYDRRMWVAVTARCHAAGLLIVCVLCFVASLSILGRPAPAMAQTTAAPTLAAPAATARVLINDAPPYRIVSRALGDEGHSGIYVDILRAMAAETGLTLRFVEAPFVRGFPMMQAGEVDIMLGPNRTPERQAYLLYLDPPLPAEPKVFLTRPQGPRIARYDDLRGLRIAVLRGAHYSSRFDADADISKEPVSDYDAALRLLGGNRVDAAIMPEQQARWLLRWQQLNLAFSSYRIEGSPSYIVIARNSPLAARAAELEAALRRLQSRGEIARILRLYS
ncbi:MAG: substrate-binding periplasmic protein [Ferrovibrio sp.]